jgi:hypothetical protein
VLEEGLVDYLLAYTPLTVLIGERVYPLILPQDPTLPALVYQRIGSVPEYSQSGYAGLTSARMQLTCWGTTLVSAKNTAEQVRLALGGYKGPMGMSTVGASFIENEMDDLDEETGLFRVIMDVTLWHEE